RARWGRCRPGSPGLVARTSSCLGKAREQPLGLRIVGAHPHQRPASLHLVATQCEHQLATPEALVWVALTLPGAAVPDLHRAAAVLPLGDLALELAVLERVILDLDRQSPDSVLATDALGHRPALEHAIQLESQVVVLVRSEMVLDHEAECAVLRLARRGARLGRLVEVTLAAVFGERHQALFLVLLRDLDVDFFLDLLVELPAPSLTLRFRAAPRSSTLGSSEAARLGADLTRLVPCFARRLISAWILRRKVSLCSLGSHSAAIESISVRASLASSGL